MIKYLLIIILLASCYTERKAKGQFGKAVTAYPPIGAGFCALTYPCLVSPVSTSDTITVTDTIYTGGDVMFDTITVNNTVTVTKTVQLPGKTITKTVLIHDTVKVKDNAELKSCEFARDGAVRLQEAERLERVKYQNRSRKYLYYLIGAGALIALWLFFFIRKRVKK